MALQGSGLISFGDVNAELGRPRTNLLGLDDPGVRGLFRVPSGNISLSQGYGKANFTLSVTWADDYNGAGGSVGNGGEYYGYGDETATITFYSNDQNTTWTYTQTAGQTTNRFSFPGSGSAASYAQFTVRGPRLGSTGRIGGSSGTWSVTASAQGQSVFFNAHAEGSGLDNGAYNGPIQQN